MEILIQIQNSFEIQIFIITLLGLFVGSFLNVVNYRLPMMEDCTNAQMIDDYAEKSGSKVKEIIRKYKGMTLSLPRSKCPSCNHEIKFYENIPLFSYLFLKGKCSSCKTKISPEYFITELVHVILWIVAFLYLGFTLKLLFCLPMISILYSMAIIDMKHRIIFDSFSLLVLYLGFLFSDLGLNSINLSESVKASGLIFLLVYGFIIFYEKIRKFEDHMFGRGDIKLIGAMSAWLGFSLILDFLILSCFIGGLMFLILSVFNSIRSNIKEYQLPFAPSLILSFSITMLTDFKISSFVTYFI